MSKKICFIYTDTNGLHSTDENVSKKNLYNFARMISIYYSIGTFDNTNYIESKNINSILKPDTINFDKTALKIHKITLEEAMSKGINNIDVITQLKNDIKDVDIIVSHNLAFHLKTIQVECFRTAITIDFSKFILIDTISFGHSYNYPKLVDLIKKLKIKNTNLNHLEQIRNVFVKLYENYIQSII